MTHLLAFDTIHAEAQHEAFTQLNDAGRRAPVVFSHVLFTYTNKNNIRKGAITQLSHSSPDGLPRRLSTNTNPGGPQISFLSTGRNASVSTKFTNNSFFTFFINHNKD